MCSVILHTQKQLSAVIIDQSYFPVSLSIIIWLCYILSTCETEWGVIHPYSHAFSQLFYNWGHCFTSDRLKLKESFAAIEENGLGAREKKC